MFDVDVRCSVSDVSLISAFFSFYPSLGVEEGELEGMVEAVVFAVQAEPWRLEVDLWRSFVNVDGGFLERVREGWLS